MTPLLAAALLLRAGWPALAQQDAAFFDPMCGSGTLVIEAAMIAADIAPGLKRAPVIVVVTQRLSPPWSCTMSVMLKGSAFAVSLTGALLAPERPWIST